jgi:hypothetical protein
MRLIGDDYFKRYGGEVAREEREAQERDVEEKLKQIPEDEVPTVVEETPEADDSAPMPNADESETQQEAEPNVEPVPADSTGNR